MGTGEFTAGGNPMMDQHPILEGVEILLVAPCWDKLRPEVPQGWNTDLTFYLMINQCKKLVFGTLLPQAPLEALF